MVFLWCFPQIAPTVRSVWRLLYSKNICIKTQTPEMSNNYDILWGAHDWNWTYPVSHTHELPPAIRYPMKYIEISPIILVGSVFLLGKSVFFCWSNPHFFAGLNLFFRWLNHPTFGVPGKIIGPQFSHPFPTVSLMVNPRWILPFLDINFTVSSVRNFKKNAKNHLNSPKIG
jgi:hypothetical protein